MQICVDADALVFPEKGTANFEAEARVLVDWLRKDKRFYRGKAAPRQEDQWMEWEAAINMLKACKSVTSELGSHAS